MHELVLHPDCAADPVTWVGAEIQPTEKGCRARFVLRGDMSAVKIPTGAQAVREDFLWKTTCMEIFWQPDGGSYYREFNLSPSSKWAAYDFAAFRELTGNAPVPAIVVVSSHDEDELIVETDIVAELPVPAQVALNAIVEDQGGNIQFWALAFDEGKAEFHSEVCRQICVEERA